MADTSKGPADEAPAQKKESPIGFFIGILVVTLIAVGGGWFAGGQFAPGLMQDEATGKTVEVVTADNTKAPAKDKKEEKSGKKATTGPVMKLDPIIVVLQDSDNAFLRFEIAVIMEKSGALNDEEKKTRLISDISAFAKTLSLKQISGPSGYIHFREDIIDRARISTGGLIKDILILSLVAE